MLLKSVYPIVIHSKNVLAEIVANLAEKYFNADKVNEEILSEMNLRKRLF